MRALPLADRAGQLIFLAVLIGSIAVASDMGLPGTLQTG